MSHPVNNAIIDNLVEELNEIEMELKENSEKIMAIARKRDVLNERWRITMDKIDAMEGRS